MRNRGIHCECDIQSARRYITTHGSRGRPAASTAASACSSPATPASRARGFANGCWASARMCTAWRCPRLKPSLFFALELERRMKHAIQDIRNAHELEHAIRECGRSSFFISPRRRSCAFPIASRCRLSPPTRSARPMCSRPCARTNLPCTIVVVTTRQVLRRTTAAPRSFQGERSARRPRSLQREQGGGGNRRRVVSRFVFRAWHAMSRSPPPARATSSAAAIGPRTASCPTRFARCPRASRSRCAIPVSRARGSTSSSRSAVISCSARNWRQARATKSPEEIARYAQAFNFGPEPDANRTVRELVEEILQPLARHVGADRAGKASPGSAAPQPRHRQGPRRARLATALGFCARRVAETVAWYRECPARAPSRGDDRLHAEADRQLLRLSFARRSQRRQRGAR